MTPAKRMLDVLVTGGVAIILWPLMGLIALAVKIGDGGPVLFRQTRVGRHGEEFIIYKFRTMVANAEQLGLPLTMGRDPRITRLGRLIRHYKLDELPQLWNVLKGDMTLVGPRPEVPYYVERYDPSHRRVLELTPGITDPATLAYVDESEILGSTLDYENVYIGEVMPRKIQLNLEYADRATLRSDLGVLFATVRRIFGKRGGGVSAAEATVRTDDPRTGRTTDQ